MVAIDTLPEAARQVVQDLRSELARLRQIIHLKDEQIRLLNLRIFGPKSEKLSGEQMLLLQGEVSLSASEVDKESQLPQGQKDNPLPKAKKARSNHPGRQVLPAHLERREEIIACCPPDCNCDKCGERRPFIGYDVREELMCEPARFWVKVIKLEKLGSCCLEEQGVVRAQGPAQIVPKGKFSNEFIIEVLARKYQQHTPVYRQLSVLAEDQDIELSRRTLNTAVLKAGDLLSAVVRAQREELLAGSYIQADETTMPCQGGDKPGRNHRAYMWEYSVPGGIVVFDFQMGRGRDGPAAFLKDFRGTLQSDGYPAYADLGSSIVHAGCMAHVRRGFVEAGKVSPLDPLPQEILAQIGLLYAVENEARQAALSPSQRLASRQSRSLPVMNALKDHLWSIRQKTSPGCALAKAIDYALGQWSRLEVYLRDGHIEIDNNWCEGAIRPLALGRKNWLHIGSEDAGPKVAAIASIVETCRRLDINLRQYLADVLPKLAGGTTSQIARLTPSAWKASRPS